MEASYLQAGTMISAVMRSCMRLLQGEEKKMTMQNFVMKKKEAQDYLISERNATVEIRDGFNPNLVVQRYVESGKIIIYIPEGWQKKITVEVRSGTGCCHQKEPCPGLKISVKKGTVLGGETAR